MFLSWLKIWKYWQILGLKFLISWIQLVFASHYRLWNRHGECWILFQPYREQNVWNVNKNIKSMFPFCFQGCSWVLNWSSNMWVDNWNVPGETLTLKTIALFCQNIRDTCLNISKIIVHSTSNKRSKVWIMKYFSPLNMKSYG